MIMIVNKKKGTITITIAISMVVLLLCVALSIDIGMLAVEKSSLQNACDAAALAAARELPNTTKAESVARKYAVDNGAENDKVNVAFSEKNYKITVTAENNEVKFLFAPLMNKDKGQVVTSASAITGSISGMKNLRPYAIEDTTLEFNKEYNLKEGAGNGYSGNYGTVYLEGSGADDLKETVRNGSKEMHYIGDLIYTATGNKVSVNSEVQTLISKCKDGCTSNNYKENCPRLITIPIVDSLNVNGKKSVEIVGFAKFFINELSIEGNGNGHTTIKGYFIKSVESGKVDGAATNYGLSGIKLVK
ncbi:pilus assembly protein TadG-related protein [Clostridium grantii]|uniref:Putative Flp pilus-assembly TadE/G-like n=1 Tax=Clostridium grantii DSM 8605 TaxID=1121316 RepID=A0A1M5XB40_9CLOT|nr:pilus assembly protein TadG-related protein [Clostridium grantii]SHH97031.1 Putative Flp pilus-assembly TadE/G-like [Clostridium grantii DSM 8605]